MKNFVQNGMTIPLANMGSNVILSGQLVVLGSLAAVAITDINPGETGDGFTEGVFLLPKAEGDEIPVGSKVVFSDGVIQLQPEAPVDDGDGDGEASAQADDVVVVIGTAWETAESGDTVIEVKINA